MLTGLTGICEGAKVAALAMTFKLIESAQRRWRMVNAQHLVALVRASATFVNDELLERPGDPSREASSPANCSRRRRLPKPPKDLDPQVLTITPHGLRGSQPRSPILGAQYRSAHQSYPASTNNGRRATRGLIRSRRLVRLGRLGEQDMPPPFSSQRRRAADESGAYPGCSKASSRITTGQRKTST
jgi:hypothetical protein